MNNVLISIRQNKFASWGIALTTGLIFRYVFWIVKRLIWHPNSDFLSSFVNTISNSQLVCLTVALSFGINLSASFLAALICGTFLIYVVQNKAFFFSLGSVAIYFLLSYKAWCFFWKAPDLGTQISMLMGPILVSIVFVSTVWLLVKVKERITPGSTGSLRAP